MSIIDFKHIFNSTLISAGISQSNPSRPPQSNSSNRQPPSSNMSSTGGRHQKIFRGQSDEDLRGGVFNELNPNADFVINPDDIPLDNVLKQVAAYASGDDFYDSGAQGFSDSRQFNNLREGSRPDNVDEAMYFSYGTEIERGREAMNQEAEIRENARKNCVVLGNQQSPEFNKVMIGKKDLEMLKKDSLNIQAQEGAQFGDTFGDSGDIARLKIDSKRKMNTQFSLSNKEFLKSKEQVKDLRFPEREGTLTTNQTDSLREPSPSQAFGTGEKIEPGSFGDSLDKAMKQRMLDEGVQIVQGELAEEENEDSGDSSRDEVDSLAIEESLARNEVHNPEISLETNQFRGSVSIGSGEVTVKALESLEGNDGGFKGSREDSSFDEILGVEGRPAIAIIGADEESALGEDQEEENVSEDMSDQEEFSINTDEFLMGNSGISSRLNSPVSLKEEINVAELKAKQKSSIDGALLEKEDNDSVLKDEEPDNRVLEEEDEQLVLNKERIGTPAPDVLEDQLNAKIVIDSGGRLEMVSQPDLVHTEVSERSLNSHTQKSVSVKDSHASQSQSHQTRKSTNSRGSEALEHDNINYGSSPSSEGRRVKEVDVTDPVYHELAQNIRGRGDSNQRLSGFEEGGAKISRYSLGDRSVGEQTKQFFEDLGIEPVYGDHSAKEVKWGKRETWSERQFVKPVSRRLDDQKEDLGTHTEDRKEHVSGRDLQNMEIESESRKSNAAGAIDDQDETLFKKKASGRDIDHVNIEDDKNETSERIVNIDLPEVREFENRGSDHSSSESEIHISSSSQFGSQQVIVDYEGEAESYEFDSKKRVEVVGGEEIEGEIRGLGSVDIEAISEDQDMKREEDIAIDINMKEDPDLPVEKNESDQKNKSSENSVSDQKSVSSQSNNSDKNNISSQSSVEMVDSRRSESLRPDSGDDIEVDIDLDSEDIKPIDQPEFSEPRDIFFLEDLPADDLNNLHRAQEAKEESSESVTLELDEKDLAIEQIKGNEEVPEMDDPLVRVNGPSEGDSPVNQIVHKLSKNIDLPFGSQDTLDLDRTLRSGSDSVFPVSNQSAEAIPDIYFKDSKEFNKIHFGLEDSGRASRKSSMRQGGETIGNENEDNNNVEIDIQVEDSKKEESDKESVSNNQDIELEINDQENMENDIENDVENIDKRSQDNSKEQSLVSSHNSHASTKKIKSANKSKKTKSLTEESWKSFKSGSSKSELKSVSNSSESGDSSKHGSTQVIEIKLEKFESQKSEKWDMNQLGFLKGLVQGSLLKMSNDIALNLTANILPESDKEESLKSVVLEDSQINNGSIQETDTADILDSPEQKDLNEVMKLEERPDFNNTETVEESYQTETQGENPEIESRDVDEMRDYRESQQEMLADWAPSE